MNIVKYSYSIANFLFLHFEKMVNIHERRKCGIPVIIEGETGVGKTALLQMLSILWNTSYNDYYRQTAHRIGKLIEGILDRKSCSMNTSERKAYGA